jgi:hypothetical protein
MGRKKISIKPILDERLRMVRFAPFIHSNRMNSSGHIQQTQERPFKKGL